MDVERADRIVFVARRRGVAWRSWSHRRCERETGIWLLARSAAVPNGASELLSDEAIRTFAGEGCDYGTLGLVALAYAADEEIRRNPTWLRMLMYFARAYADASTMSVDWSIFG